MTPLASASDARAAYRLAEAWAAELRAGLPVEEWPDVGAIVMEQRARWLDAERAVDKARAEREGR